MQNSYTTDAINLKAYSLSESDKIILMYSKEKGLIRGVAKGIKKTKSKLGARMDLLVANTVMLHKGKNLNTICQAECLNTFKKTRTDLDKIFYSMYIGEVISNFGIEEDPGSEKIYNLLYQGLDTISKSENKTEIMLAVIKFQLKIMAEAGFGIEFNKCLHCGKQTDNETIYFISELGGIVCEECSNYSPYHKKQIPLKLRDFLKQMLLNSFDEKGYYEEKANEKVCTVVFNLLKEYIEKKCPKKFKSSKVLQELA